MIRSRSRSRGGVVSAAFTPASLSGLELWLDASDANTLWEDTGATIPATTVVGRWDDKSGNGNNALSFGAPYNPTTNSRTMNSKNSLLFSGSHLLTLPSSLYAFPNLSEYSVFIVFQKDSTAARCPLWGDSASGDWGFYVTDDQLHVFGGGKTITQYFQVIGTTAHIAGLRKDSIARDIFCDGQQNYASESTSVTLTNLSIGMNLPAKNQFDGLISEIIFYNRKLTAKETDGIGKYLSNKWGAIWEDWHTEGEELIGAATTNYTPENTTSISGYTNFVNYVPFVIAEDMEYLVLSDNTWFHTASSQGVIGNDFIIEERSLISESQNIAVPVTWPDGSTSKTIRSGYADYHTNKIYPSSFGLTKFTKGEVYYIKEINSVPVAGDRYPIQGRYAVSQIGLNTQTAVYNPASTTPSNVNEVGQFTATGTALSNITYAYRPFVLGKPVNASAISIIGIGDSITYGSGDTGTPQIHGIGYLQRAIREGGDYIPCINNGRNSITAANTNIWTYWRFFLRYANTAVVALGTNDMSSGPTLATLQSRIQTTWDIVKHGRVSKIIEVPLLTNTTSTDNYLTTTNQTINSNWVTVPSQFNDWLATKVTDLTIDGVIDRSGVVDATEPYKWGVDGVTTRLYNSDTVHPNANGCSVLGTATRTAIDAL